jgi:ketosteroid isomerase-like protein
MNWKRTGVIVVLIAASMVSVAQQTTKEKPAPAQESTAFTVNDANTVLNQVRDAIAAHSPDKFIALAAADKMTGYVSFHDQIQAFFAHNDGIRVNIYAIHVSAEGDKGFINAGFQMELTPRSSENTVRRETQLRIELQRTEKGWRIIEIDPLSFFS